MPLYTVAKELGLPMATARAMVVDLAAGGVIRQETADSTIAVQPEVLRETLVRDVFLRTPGPHPILPFLELAPNLRSATEVIIGACRRGGEISQDLLLPLLERCGSPNLWKRYAGLGPDETRRALKCAPERLNDLAAVALYHIPDEILPDLLAAANRDERPTHQYPEHPLRRIEDWVEAVVPGTGEGIVRRNLLVSSIEKWLDKGRPSSEAAKALRYAMSPKFEGKSVDPGLGKSWTLTWGPLTVEELLQLDGIWSSIRAIIQKHNLKELLPLLQCTEDLVYSARWNRGRPVADKVNRITKALGKPMLTDLAQEAGGDPGILHRIRSAGESLRINTPVVDPEFDILYPPDSGSDFRAQMESQTKAAEKLAAAWTAEDAVTTAKRIARLEASAARAGINWPRMTPTVCRALAASVSSPVQWTKALMSQNTSPDTVGPFLAAVVKLEEQGWVDLLAEAVSYPALRPMAAQVVLSTSATPPELFGAVSEVLPEMRAFVEEACAGDIVTNENLPLLLGHESAAVASAAAIGLWSRYGDAVPADLKDLWRAGLIRAEGDEPELIDIFREDPQIAEAWLSHHISPEPNRPYPLPPGLSAALQSISQSAKEDFIETVPEGFLDEDVVATVIGSDTDLYSKLLGSVRLKDWHLAPLEQGNDEKCLKLLPFAIDAGYSAKHLAGTRFYPREGWTGEQSDMWSRRIERFNALLPQPDPRVTQVINELVTGMQAAKVKALENERREAIYGIR